MVKREVLATTLESYLLNLRHEISDTDGYDFRQQLKAKKVLLMKIAAELEKSD